MIKKEIIFYKLVDIYRNINKNKFISKIKNEKIKNAYNKLLRYASDLYYNTDKTILTDFEFDDISKIINFNEVGSRTKLNLTSQHKYPHLAGTIEKINYDDLEDKIYKIYNLNTSNNKFNYEISLKEDGISVVINYKNNKIISALTRGKNNIGGEVTDLFKKKFEIKNYKFKNDVEFGIKFEAVMDHRKFNEFNEKNNFKFSSPRSAISGILSNKDSLINKNYKYIQLVPLEIAYEDKYKNIFDNIIGDNKNEFIKKLFLNNEDVFDKIYIYEKSSNKICINNIKEFFKKCNEDIKNENINRSADGIVISFGNEKSLYGILGRKDNKNEYEFCLKFPSEEKVTKVEDINFYIGRSGIITPVVRFKELEFFGNKCTNVSIANYKRFKELKLAKDDEVIIKYRNDVLCYLESIINKSKNKPIKFIHNCPICNSKLKVTKNKTFVLCNNDECTSNILGKIENFLIKIGIKNIRLSTIERLYEAGIIKNYLDLFKDNFSKNLFNKNIEGFQEKLKTNIVTTLNEFKNKEIEPYIILGALGIKGISTKTFKLLIDNYILEEILEIMNNKFDKVYNILSQIKGLETLKIKSLYIGFYKNKNNIRELMSLMNIKMDKDNTKYKLFCTSGFRPKQNFIDEMKNDGYMYSENMNKDVSILFVNNDNESSKVKQAKKYNIKIKKIG